MARSSNSVRRKSGKTTKSAAIVKHLTWEEKAAFTVRSFEAKLEMAETTLASWRKAGSRPKDKCWFETKAGFREKHDPDNQLYDWGSPNIMSGSSETYTKLVEKWTALQTKAADFQSVEEVNDDLQARLNAALAQVAKMQFNLAEVMDALKRVNPMDEVFARVDLAW